MSTEGIGTESQEVSAVDSSPVDAPSAGAESSDKGAPADEPKTMREFLDAAKAKAEAREQSEPAKKAGVEAKKLDAQAPKEMTASQVQAYQANYKYKVLKEEKELPEWVRPLISSQESEKQVRDLFERAEGLPIVKDHRDRLESELNLIRDQWGPVVESTQQALAFRDKGDLQSFFEAANISDNAILKHAHDILQRRERPELAAQHEQTRSQSLEYQSLQNNYNSLNQQFRQLAVQTRTNELSAQLGRPEIHQVAQAYDARVGRPGAFREECVRRGQFYAYQNQDVPAEQVVNEVYGLFSPLQSVGTQPEGTVRQAAQVPVSERVVAPDNKPTLPNIQGRGTSPTKQLPRSVADLRAMAKSMRT